MITNEALDSIVNRLLLEKLRCGIDIQENAIIQAFDLARITWPHDQTEFVDVLLVRGLKEARHASYLLVVLIEESLLDNL